jgi:hypothetical protein
MSPWSNLSELVASVVLTTPRPIIVAATLIFAACKSGANFPTTTEFPETPRRAPGIAVDPLSELPRPTQAAEAEAGLNVLTPPADAGRARGIVRQFFRAAVAENAEDLEPLIAQQAWLESGGTRQPARAFWRTRMSQLDYGTLAGQLIYREAQVETYRAEDATRLGPNRRIPTDIKDDEILVRVPIAVSWTGRTRLFGDEVVFRVRPSGSRYEITEIVEDFRLP